MAFDAFDVGIVPGGLRSKSDIKLLICYILKSVNVPLSKNDILTVVSETGLANYFESVEAFNSLIKNGNIKTSGENGNLFIPTDSGLLICKELEDDLPVSVKEKAYCATLLLIEQQRKEKENIVTIQKINNGFSVNCNIGDESTELLKINLYVPESDQAKIVKQNFQQNADLIYKITIAALTQNIDMVKETLEDIEKLNN